MSALVHANALNLSPAVEAYIQKVHLKPSEQDIVRECISHYSMPHTFCDILKWIVFREYA